MSIIGMLISNKLILRIGPYTEVLPQHYLCLDSGVDTLLHVSFSFSHLWAQIPYTCIEGPYIYLGLVEHTSDHIAIP